MAPGVCGFRRRNFWLEFEESNPEGLRSTLFPGELWSPPGKSRELRAPLVLAEQQRFSSGAFSVQFRPLDFLRPGRALEEAQPPRLGHSCPPWVADSG